MMLCFGILKTLLVFCLHMMVSDSVFLWVFLCGHVSLAVFMLPVLFLFFCLFYYCYLFAFFFLKRETSSVMQKAT